MCVLRWLVSLWKSVALFFAVADCGKSDMRQATSKPGLFCRATIHVAVGLVLFAMIPIAIAMITAVHLLTEHRKYTAERFAALALLVKVCVFFGLNTTSLTLPGHGMSGPAEHLIN